jgi:cysteinyl-tRNA synthetase
MLTVFDLVQRYLRSRGYAVTYVRNITDIDDKIIQRAKENGEDWKALANRFIAAMHEDCALLGLQAPDAEPRATEYIPEIVSMTQALIDKGYAYRAENGDVMYAVRKFPAYGALSGRNIDESRAGARVQIDEFKHDPLDFVVWKHAKTDEPQWPSPWGPGRPGWHIECSAMSTTLLGDYFDLHGGGMDLKFPHHENEIAQTCAACGSPFVHVWMHNGFVNIDEEKMSKSLGNFFTVRDVVKTLRDPEVLRFFLLGSHYRGPINYSAAQLAQADETLAGLYRALKDAAPAAGAADERDPALQRFHAAMDDDFNTPEALAVLAAAARELNIAKAADDASRSAAAARSLLTMGKVLGVLQQSPDAYLKRGSKLGTAGITENSDAMVAAGQAVLSDAQIEQLIAERRAARAAKNFAESDRIRDQLSAAGVMLEDKPGGLSEWRRA